MTTERLKPSGEPVRLGNFILRTPGVEGIAELHVGAPGGLRGEQVEGTYDDVFRAHLDERGAVELKAVTLVGPPPTDSRTRGEERLVTIQGPEVDERETQVAVVQNEDGSMSWHFPLERTGVGVHDVKEGGRRTFEIPLRPMGVPSVEAQTRGPLGLIGRKILKVFGFRIAGEIGEGLVRHWERAKRPHRVREFKHDNIQRYDVEELKGARWADLSAGPTLLFLHGINSQIHSGFHALPPEHLALLDQRYEGRVAGFDHPTVGFDPVENVAALREKVPDGSEIELDIVCHSRGGLVARELAEHAGAGLRVRKVIFVATPNAGTALADSAHIRSFLDTYTNFFGLIPAVGFVDILETIINVAKEVALNTHEQLRGIQAANPQGRYLARLNSGGDTDATYSAVTADFEPGEDDRFPLWLRDRLFDEVFETNNEPVENDLVVPTEGVYAANGAARFPIDDLCSFDSGDAVHHSAFFGNPTVLSFLHERLQG